MTIGGHGRKSTVWRYIALLTQVQSLLDSGMSESEINTLFPNGFPGALEQMRGDPVRLGGRENAVAGISVHVWQSAAEVLKIATDLDMTGARARWDEFASNPGAITTKRLFRVCRGRAYGSSTAVVNAALFPAMPKSRKERAQPLSRRQRSGGNIDEVCQW